MKRKPDDGRGTRSLATAARIAHSGVTMPSTPCWPMTVRRLSRGATSVASLLRWLLFGATLQTAATARTGFDVNFGNPVYGLLLYRNAEGPARPYCTVLSARFRLPPLYEQDDVSRGVEFRYANRSCQLDLGSASAKHVFLIVPVNDTACPFEDSLAQAISAKAYSLIVACDTKRKVHLDYFTSGENYTVPVQDLIVGFIRHDRFEAFKPKNAGIPVISATNVSYSGGDTAELYVLEANGIIGASLIWIMACTTIGVGALWSGSTRKLLYLTQHRRAKPKGKQQRKEDAELDPALLGPDFTASCPAAATSTKVRSKSRHHHRDDARARPSKCSDDFPSSDNDALDEEVSFAECPVGCNLLTLFVLMLAVNLLVLYYFFNKLWFLLVGCVALGSVMSLIVIFNSLAFLIPCASMRMPNVLFPCFVQSMEIRHHVVIWCAISVPLVWVVFRKAHHAWILQNLLGSSFALNILRCVHLPNFKVITFISILMFFDDIFMVFITSLITKDLSVMESVASGVQDLPVLMRVPLFLIGDATACNDSSAILGYGDIAIPGLAIAYCRSYDVIVKNKPWYFLVAITCYGASLVLTFFMSYLMKTGQPALLYLVPGVLLPTIMLAWCRGDLNQFWSGEFVPSKGLMSSHLDVCVSSSEQFQMNQSRGLLYVTTPLFPWLAVPLPVSQKAYDAKSH